MGSSAGAYMTVTKIIKIALVIHYRVYLHVHVF